MALRYRAMIAFAICIVALAAFGIFWTRSNDARAPSVPDDGRAENGDRGKASGDAAEALRLKPQDAAFYYNRGNEWFQKNDFDQAVADYSKAIHLNPNDALALSNRGLAWRNKGETDKAIVDFDEAVRLDPLNAGFFFNRGNAWFRKREYDKALADYTEAIGLNRQFNFFYDRRAWLLASCPVRQYRNGPEAVKDATRACELSDWKSSTSVRILGAAYAEAGDFPQAVKWLAQAMSMDGHERELRARMLALFEAGTPYRDDVPAATED